MTTASEPLLPNRTRCARLGLLLALFALLLTPVALLADKAVVPLVLGTAVTGGLLAGAPALPWRLIDRPLALTLGIFLAWCLISASWSPDPGDAAILALRIGLLLYLLVYLAGLTRLLDATQRGRVTRYFAVGFGLTVAVIVAEFALHTPLFDLLQGQVQTDYAAHSRLNRGVSATAILVWPLALFAWRHRQHLLAAALPAGIFVLTLFSQSSASVLALAAGLLAAALAGLGRTAARLVLVLAIAGALFAAPVAVDLLQQVDLEHSDLVPETGQYRLHFWNVISQRIAERPLFGWGFDASAKLPTGDAQPFRPGASVIPSHPHNGALQIMVELGVLGSLLAAALLYVIGSRIDRLAPAPRAFAVAMTITILGIACTAYGIWQSHWLSVIGAAGVIFMALPPPAEGGREQGTIASKGDA